MVNSVNTVAVNLKKSGYLRESSADYGFDNLAGRFRMNALEGKHLTPQNLTRS